MIVNFTEIYLLIIVAIAIIAETSVIMHVKRNLKAIIKRKG